MSEASLGRAISRGSFIADDWAVEELASLDKQKLRRHLEPLASPQGVLIRVGAETLVNFSSNNYLGLASHPRLIAAATETLRHHGVGTGASRLIVGDSLAHHALEQKVAAFVSAPSAVLFNSGYSANVGALSSLVGEGDVIFSDELNHASIVDGCRLSKATKVVFRHRDLNQLRSLLASTRGRRRLVCTESIFSMDGDRAPLEELAELCRDEHAALMVDEAHAFGLLGRKGAGLCEELDLVRFVDVRVGTFGKACGVFGAFVAGGKSLTEFLINSARPLIFSTSIPAALCGATSAAIDLIESEGPRLRERLWNNVERFAAGLRTLGIPTSADSAIFPVIVGKPESALEAAGQLRRRGLLVKAIRPPTVPEGTSRLRFALSADHSNAQIDLAISALVDLKTAHAA